ncbi:hypothetical protein NTE_00963 [Candidatus Nitrososphaera evergladensis SR1]|uniref:Uncharacterized protein n=2 Tax=Nitrososphaera TaxID=497726 RepID=A0A075MPA2_9ARCH|nr:hypothetical protein NTE_00963 [Candidatus Nitrososphaera evergladensis SR1]
MESRYFAFSAIAAVLVFGVLASVMSVKSAYAADDLWYVGEGAKQDTYVKYRIQEYDTNNDAPFDMTIYFKGKDDRGAWIAPTFVEYQGNVYNGTLRLGDNLAALGGGSQVPDDMRPFVGAYGRSLQWLEAFTSVSAPLSLKAGSWGKIAAIGGEELKPQGQQKVTVPAGTFDTTVVGWHKGVDNKIWIENEFPFPIKAETFVEVASGKPPIQFKFDLLATGTGQPPVPKSVEEIPQPPLRQSTARGTYDVTLSWNPVEIQPNGNTTFTVDFADNNGQKLERVNYDFTVTEKGGKVIYDKKNAFTGESSTGVQTVKMGNGGPVSISIVLHSVSGVNTGAFTEEADFGVVVVPEFPVSAAIIAAIAVAFIVAMTRFKGIGIGGMFGGRNSAL